MTKKWELNILGLYGAQVPEAVQAEVRRLSDLLMKHCLGPYDESGVRIGLAVRIEGEIGVPFTQTGIRTEPFSQDMICANIYVKKADWKVPLESFQHFLWLNVNKAIWSCVDKLKKKSFMIDADRFRQHLSLVESDFFGKNVKSAKPNVASKSESMPVDVYPEDEPYPVVIQYRLEVHGSGRDHDRRVEVENILSELLESRDLGYCDGGDIGSGTMNIFCFVKPGKMAAQAIIETLRKHDHLDDAVIAQTVKGEEKVVWPPEFVGEFSIL